MRSADFIGSLGVNTHFNYLDGAYANVSNVLADLAYLGISHVRDHTPTPWNPGAGPMATYIRAANAGIQFDFVVGAGTDIPTELSEAAAVEKSVPGSVAAIEGFNEINNWPVTFKGKTSVAAAITAQQYLFAAITSNKTYDKTPIYDLTGAPRDTLAYQTLSGLADFANVHFYPQNGMQPAGWLSGGYGGSYGFAGPAVVTEFGYFTIPQSGWYLIGVDEKSQAKGLLNGFMDAVSQGYTSAYAYELLDEKPDPAMTNCGMHFGMFRNDNTPKPVAVALHNLTRLLTDNGANAASFQPKALNYTLANLPATGNSLLLQQSSGHFQLIVWNEAPFWDHVNGKEAPVTPTAVRLILPVVASKVGFYDPTISASLLAANSNVQIVELPITDHPVVIDIDL